MGKLCKKRLPWKSMVAQKKDYDRQTHLACQIKKDVSGGN